VSFTARELLSSDTLRVPAGARPSDYQNEVGANPALSFAVFDGETLLGLVGSQAVRSGPERIFADLCHAVSSTPIPDSTPLEEILAEMDRQGTNALPVSDGQGRFQGIVTRTGINNFLLGQSERRQRETEVLAELARTINASLDLGTVLQRAAERAKDLCKSDIAKIALRDPGSEAMVFRHLVGSRYQGYDSFRIEPGEGSGGQVLVTERPFRTDHYAEDPRISKDYLGAALEEGIVAELIVPIWIGDRVEGLLFVQNRTSRPFTDQDEVILLRLADHAAIAIQNARLYEETERRRRTAESLAEVGRLISQSLTPEQVGQQIADRVRALFGALASVLFQLEPDSGDLVALAVSGDVGPTFGRNLVFPKGTGLAGLAMRERHPMVTPDLLRDSRLAFSPETRARLEQTVHRAVLAVPLLVADSAIGALSIGDRAGRTFNDEEIRLAQAFADQAALALENARLLQELRTRQARLEALLEVSRELSRIQPLESVLTSISRVCATLLGTDSVGFRLLDGDELVVMGTWGDAAEAMATPRLKIGESLSGRVAATGEPLLITDLPNDPRLIPAHREADRRLGHRAFLGVPLKAGERVVGVLSIRTRREEGFSAEDVATATAFASQAALALENARLYQRAEERAEKLTALSTLTQRITSAKDSREVFNAVAEAATTLLGAKMARVWVDDPGARALRAQGNFSTEARFLPLMTSFSTLAYGTGVVSAAFESRAPAYIRDIQQDTRLINEELVKEADLHAFAGVPLITGNRVLGVLAILFGERPQFTREEKELISLLADQAAIAIEQSRLFEEARRSYEELERTQAQLVRSERLHALGE
jgi:GAF domain-containing protein